MTEKIDELKEVKKKIRDNIYFTKPKFCNGENKRRRTSEIWESIHQIYEKKNDDDVLIKNFVSCSLCDAVFVYDMIKVGTNIIRKHIAAHKNAETNNAKMNSFYPVLNKTISAEEKEKNKEAAMKFVVRDLPARDYWIYFARSPI